MLSRILPPHLVSLPFYWGKVTSKSLEENPRQAPPKLILFTLFLFSRLCGRVATPRLHTGPEILEIRKVHFEVRKMPFLTPPPPKKALKRQINSLKKSEKSQKVPQKEYLIDFSRPFLGGVKNGIFQTSKCTFRISRISGPVWGQEGVRNGRVAYFQTARRYGVACTFHVPSVCVKLCCFGSEIKQTHS